MTTTLPEVLGPDRDGRVVLTDSGLGGLSICAGLERRLRGAAGGRRFDLVYVNAWPDEARGYNDLAGEDARAAVFDRALAAMARYRPDLLVIACNTLSVVYERTAFARSPVAPVSGILDAGVALFARALGEDAAAALILFGTKTTIGSGEHARRLAASGVDPHRIRAVACHGLAAAIDKDPDAEALPGLVEACVAHALEGGPVGPAPLAGLACTHYGYVAGEFGRAFERLTGAPVRVLDPNERLIEDLTAGLDDGAPSGGGASSVTVEVVSKVALAEGQRQAVARRLEHISPATALALAGYTHIPTLF
ncbi:MAG: aspartate/glutamate racemase family protein [Acidobacteria bacterium]|jgi:glutamate racemase|nr:aspartate/glutamate racemase family protein [Acidobacteriota bacterium]